MNRIASECVRPTSRSSLTPRQAKSSGCTGARARCLSRAVASSSLKVHCSQNCGALFAAARFVLRAGKSWPPTSRSRRRSQGPCRRPRRRRSRSPRRTRARSSRTWRLRARTGTGCSVRQRKRKRPSRRPLALLISRRRPRAPLPRPHYALGHLRQSPTCRSHRRPSCRRALSSVHCAHRRRRGRRMGNRRFACRRRRSRPPL